MTYWPLTVSLSLTDSPHVTAERDDDGEVHSVSQRHVYIYIYIQVGLVATCTLTRQRTGKLCSKKWGIYTNSVDRPLCRVPSTALLVYYYITEAERDAFLSTSDFGVWESVPAGSGAEPRPKTSFIVPVISCP